MIIKLISHSKCYVFNQTRVTLFGDGRLRSTILFIKGAGGEPRRTGDGRGTRDRKRKGGKWDLYDGGKQKRNSKRQLSLFVTAYHPVKEMNPTTFLDFHLPSPRLKAKFYLQENSKNKNSYLG